MCHNLPVLTLPGLETRARCRRHALSEGFDDSRVQDVAHTSAIIIHVNHVVECVERR